MDGEDVSSGLVLKIKMFSFSRKIFTCDKHTRFDEQNNKPNSIA